MEDETEYCPRALYYGKLPHMFQVAKDPAVMLIAKKIVAGIDHRYELDPSYADMLAKKEHLLALWGEKKTEEHFKEEKRLIESAVDIQGACDIIQTDMDLGGVGLFGGLSWNRRKFIFYDWGWFHPLMVTSMTRQEARDIVSGKKKLILFRGAKRSLARRREKK